MVKTSEEWEKTTAMLRSSPRLKSSADTRSSPRTRDSPANRASPRSDRLPSTPAASPAKTTAAQSSSDLTVSRVVKRRLLEEAKEIRAGGSPGNTSRSSPRTNRASSPDIEASSSKGNDRPIIRLLKRHSLEETKGENAEEKTRRASPRSTCPLSTQGTSRHNTNASSSSRAISPVFNNRREKQCYPEVDSGELSGERKGSPVFDRRVKRCLPEEVSEGLNGERRSSAFEGVKRCLPEEESGGIDGERKKKSLRVKLHHLKPDVLQELCAKTGEFVPGTPEEHSRKNKKPLPDGTASKFLKSLAETERRSCSPPREGTPVEPSRAEELTPRLLRVRSQTEGVDHMKSEMSNGAGCSKCRDPGNPNGSTPTCIPCKCRDPAPETERDRGESCEHELQLGEVGSPTGTSDHESEMQNSGSDQSEAAHPEKEHCSPSCEEKTGNAGGDPLAGPAENNKGTRGCLINWFASPEYICLGYVSNMEDYMCMRCALQGTSLSVILQHLIPSPRATRCDICGAFSTSPCMERLHNLKEHQFVCHLCSKRFKSSREAFEHALHSHPSGSVRSGSSGTYHGGPHVNFSYLRKMEKTLHGLFVGEMQEPPPNDSSPYIISNIPGISLSRKQAISKKYGAFIAMKDAYESGMEVSSSVVMCPLCPAILKDFPGVERHVVETHRPNNSRELGDVVELEMKTQQVISMETPYCVQCNKFFQNSTALRRHTAVVHTVSTPYRLALSQQKAKDDIQEMEYHQDRGTETWHESATGSTFSGTRDSRIQDCNDTDIVDVESIDDTPDTVVDAKEADAAMEVATPAKSEPGAIDRPPSSFNKLPSILDGDTVETHEIKENWGTRKDTGKVAAKPVIVKSRSYVGGASWEVPDCLFSLYSMRDCTPAILQELDSNIEKALKDLKFGESYFNGRQSSASHFQAGGPIAAYMKLKPILDNLPRTPTARQNYKTSHKYKIPMGNFSPEFEETPLFPTLRELFTRTNGYKNSPLSILTAKEVKKTPLVGIYSKKKKKKLAKKLSKALEGAFMDKSIECIQAAARGHTMFRRGHDMQSHSFISDRVVAHLNKKLEDSGSRHGAVDRRTVDNSLLQRGSVNNSHPSAVHHTGVPAMVERGQCVSILTSQGRVQVVINSRGQTKLYECPPSTSQSPAQGTGTTPGLQPQSQTRVSHRQVIMLPKPSGPPPFFMHNQNQLPQQITAASAPGSTTQPHGRPVLGTLTQSDLVRLQQLNSGIGPRPPPLQLAPRVPEKPKTVNDILAQQRQLQQFLRPQPPPLLRAPVGHTRSPNPGTVQQVFIIQQMKKPTEPTAAATNLPGGIQPAATSISYLTVPRPASSDARISSAQPLGISDTLHGEPSNAATSSPAPVTMTGSPSTGASVNLAGGVSSAAAPHPDPMRLPSTSEAGAQNSVGAYLMRVKQTFSNASTSDNPRPCPPLVQMKPVPPGEQHCRNTRDGGIEGRGHSPPEVIRVSPEKKLVVKYKDGSSLTLPFLQRGNGPVEPKPGTRVKSKKNVVKVKSRASRSVDWYCRKLWRRTKYEKKLRRTLKMGMDYSAVLKLTKTIRQVPIVTTNVLCRAVDADVVMRVSEAVRRGKRATIKLDDYRHLYYRYIDTGSKK